MSQLRFIFVFCIYIYVFYAFIYILSSSITHDGLSKSKVDPCGVCSLRAKANSVLCVQSGKWIHGKYNTMNFIEHKNKAITARMRLQIPKV